ncbi:TIGR02265 family protein [Archangium violaceum]|uniref:TIGR02265 family protein n=1 Tax=Archangium violaceum TaxID=83451 RepID=UPI0036DB3DC5
MRQAGRVDKSTSRSMGMQSDWERTLEQLMALATSGDTARGLFLNRTLEAVRSLGDEAAMARCQAVLGQQRLMDFVNYPVTLLIRLTMAAVRELSARHGGAEQVLRMLGQKAAVGLMSSAVGSAMCSQSDTSTDHIASSLQAIYKVTSNYGERAMEWLGPRHGRLVMRRSFLPMPYHEGAMVEVLERLGARNVRVRGGVLGPLDSEYDFSWE